MSYTFCDALGEAEGDNVNRFYDALGVSSDSVAETSNVGDSEADMAVKKDVKLYKVSDAGGKLAVTEVAAMPLKQTMLNPEVNIVSKFLNLKLFTYWQYPFPNG